MSETGLERLKSLLRAVKAHDADYPTRYGLVILAMAQAHAMGYAVGFRIDPEQPDWPVVFIELLTGQVSWHMPQHEREWDGHTVTEKHERLRCFIDGTISTTDPPNANPTWHVPPEHR